MSLDTDMKSLELIRRLYEDDSSYAPLADHDPALASEYRALRAVKLVLDRRPPDRPDPSTLDAVFKAAAGTKSRGRFADRSALGPIRMPAWTGRRWVRQLAFYSMIGLLVGAGFWLQFAPQASVDTVTQAAIPEATRMDVQNEPLISSRSMLGEMETSSTSTFPRWDDSDEIRTIYFRVNGLTARSNGLNWEEPIPLEQIPRTEAELATPGQMQAGYQR